ncbi:MAG TPA: CD225/dispanin family protein [Gemmataceae bacterium]|nr:CD225/dispanin family protein [Gemmataceae bacterium]
MARGPDDYGDDRIRNPGDDYGRDYGRDYDQDRDYDRGRDYGDFRRGPPPMINNYLVPAILCTLFCCLPFGIAAIVSAAQVNTKLTVGDYKGAEESANQAKTWCAVSFGLGLVGIVIYFMVLMANPQAFR